MPLTLDQFDAEATAQKKLHAVCTNLGLKDLECKKLEGAIAEICGSVSAPASRKGKRRPSRWNLCMKECAKGKAWGPETRKQCHVQYKAGACPTPGFVAKHGSGGSP